MSEFNPSYKVDPQSGIKSSAKKGQKRPPEQIPTIPKDSDRVNLSPASRIPVSRKSSEIRQDLVDKFKAALGDGGYRIKADEIADKMVQKIRENKGPSVF